MSPYLLQHPHLKISVENTDPLNTVVMLSPINIGGTKFNFRKKRIIQNVLQTITLHPK